MTVAEWFRAEIGRAPRLYAALLVLAAACAAYANSLDGAFHYDDAHTIVDNPFVRDLRYVPGYFGHPEYFSALEGHNMYRPFLLVTYALDYHWGGYQPLAWRLTAIALHGFCAVGVFLTCLALLGRLRPHPARAGIPGALVAALFFALHPVFTETVNYASARSSLLAAACVIWALWLHLRAGEARRPGPRLCLWAGSLLLFGLALLSKEIAITFPALLLLCALLERRGYAAVLPAVAVAVLYLVVRQLVLGTAVIDFQARAAQVATADPGSGGARTIFANLCTQARVIAHYLYLFVVPRGLCVNRWVRVSTSPFEPGVIGGALLIAGLLWAAWRLRRTHPVATFGLVWFLVALAPTSSILPLNQVMNEHRLYLPGLGLALAVGALLRPWFRRRGLLPAGATLAAAGLLLALTLQRNRDWTDPLRLWESAVAVSPEQDGNWNALGVELRRCGRYDEALAAFRKSAEINPTSWSAPFNLGTLHLARGREAQDYAELEQARAYLEQSLQLRPGSERSRWFLAETWYAMGRIEKAEQTFAELSGLSPRLFEWTRYPLAKIAQDRGRPDEARRLYEEALACARDPVAARLGLAELALAEGDRVGALREAKLAMEARPHSPAPHLFLARFHAGTALAVRHLFEAERRGYRPTPAERRSLLGREP